MFNESQFSYSDVYSKFLPAITSPLLSAWRLSVITPLETTDTPKEDHSFNYREEEFPSLQCVTTTVIPHQVNAPSSPVQDDHYVSSSSSSSDTDDTDEEADDVVHYKKTKDLRGRFSS